MEDKGSTGNHRFSENHTGCPENEPGLELQLQHLEVRYLECRFFSEELVQILPLMWLWVAPGARFDGG